MKKLSIVFLLLFIALIPAFLGIFHPGFFLTDDGNWMVIRLSSFYEALRAGQFPVRFLPRLNNGYGYPVADFLYPLFLYSGSFIHIFHVNFVTTIKLLFGLSLFASAIGSFLWLRKYYGSLAGFVGALVYTLFPYHIWDITKRGSLGEVMAMGIVPFIFWQIERGSIALSALGIGLLITAHNTLAILFLPIIICYVLLERKIKQLLASVMWGLGMSAFFWVPAILDLRYTVFAKTAVAHFENYFLSLQLYPLIGIISFFIILLSVLSVFKKTNKYLVFFLVISLLSISLTNSLSKPLWQPFHLGAYVQFPFRFLSLTALGVGFLSSYIVVYWQKKYSIILAGIIVVLVYISSFQYFFANVYAYNPDTFYSTNQDSTTVKNEYMPLWVKKLPLAPQEKILATPKTNFHNIHNTGSTIFFQTTGSQAATITIATIYYPGWTGSIDMKNIQLEKSNPYGFIQFSLPRGAHTVKVWFGETNENIAADFISLFSILSIIAWSILRRKEKHG